MQNAAHETVTPDAPALDGFQLSRLAQAVEGLNREQLTWASGYLAGLGSGRDLAPQPVESAPGLTILYATVGGNARAVAESLAGEARARGLAPRLVSAEQYRVRDLGKERLLFVVISTQGEGEPPEAANELFRYLAGKRPPRLDELEYAVFGLGDASYAQFNQAARDLDARLRSLGATSVIDRVDADVDYARFTADWSARALKIAEKTRPADAAQVIPLQRQQPAAARHDRHNPYAAVVVDQRRITTADAVTAVHHLALEIDPAVIRYQPGDALGVRFHNDPALVNAILALAGLPAEAHVTLDRGPMTLFDALRSHLELTQLHPSVVAAWADVSGAASLRALAKDPDSLRAFAAERQLVDLLQAFPAAVAADDFAALLTPLQPRLYSIASSQAETPDEVHLTVAEVAYSAFGRDHSGAASGHLAHRVGEGDVQQIYVAENNAFRLPADDAVPVIMIGAGTGIAPFRAFLQERKQRGATGRNWLVFGNRHFHRDFLYQAEWIRHREAGLLHKVSLAFSRDGDERTYVQDRLIDDGAEVYRWLEQDARLYVCGSLAMERAVRQALQAIVRAHANVDEAAAEAYIADLLSQGRYQKDVY